MALPRWMAFENPATASGGRLAVFFALFILLTAFVLRAFAQNPNPIPFISLPLVPTSTAPGGPAFTLTVDGTGFVSGAVVNWNGMPRATTFVSSAQVTATILATDVITPGTAYITVSNPGAHTSQQILFPITNPVAAVGLARSYLDTAPVPCFSIVVGDFNGDGKPDIFCASNAEYSVLLGNGDGTFRKLPTVTVQMLTPIQLVAGDVNGDGKTDLIGASDIPVLTEIRPVVLIGNGDGTFQAPATFSSLGQKPNSFQLADFNRDGKLDLASAVLCGDLGCLGGGLAAVLLGNGDGTLQNPITYTVGGGRAEGLAVGDFNRDGNLDLAVSAAQVFILLGNGNGGFQTPYGIGGSFPISADLNGDGNLDLVTYNSVFLGNGDGTFRTGESFAFTGQNVKRILADFMGDGKLDLLSSNDSLPGISLWHGNGDGTFQAAENFVLEPTNIDAMDAADFDGDGKLDVIIAEGGVVSIFRQTTVLLPLTQINFGSLNNGATSAAQPIPLTNVGTSTLAIASIAVTGTNASDFSIQSNSCGAALAPGATCTVSAAFTPSVKGTRSASLAFTDGAPASPQLVSLTGTGIGTAPPTAIPSPTGVTFSSQPVSTTSAPVTITVRNTGDLTLTINGVVFVGSNPGDFSETNDCQGVTGGASCSIKAVFTPTATGNRSATLNIIDNASDSPQSISVSGTGVADSLGLAVSENSPTSATVVAGGSASYTLSVGGAGMSGTASLACTGAPTGAKCSVPATVSVNATTAMTFAAEVTTTSRNIAFMRPFSDPRIPWIWVIATPLLLLIASKAIQRSPARSCIWALPAIVVLFSFSVGCAGCGNDGSQQNPNGTPAGTYTLTVTATLGTTTQSVPLNLTVQ